MLSRAVTRRCCCLVLLAGILGFAGLRPPVVYACSCVMPSSPPNEMKRATAVFAGRVITVSGPAARPVFMRSFPFITFVRPMGATSMTFEVARVWKGLVERHIRIATAGDGSTCEYPFEMGREYIVYARNTQIGLETVACSRTKLLDDAQEDAAALGAGAVPNRDGSMWSEVGFFSLPVLLIVVVLVVLATLVLRRRRRTAAEM